MYASCTLLATTMATEQPHQEGAESETRSKGAIEACIEWLMDNEFIHIQKEEDGNKTMDMKKKSDNIFVWCVMDVDILII